MMPRRLTVIAFALAACSTFGSTLHAAPPDGLKQKVDAWVTANQRAIVTELVDLLAIPERRRRSREHPEQRRAPAEMLGSAGLTAEMLETAGNPLVWGELKAAGATRTLLLYGHYDGQPVTPRTGSSRSLLRRSCAPGEMDDDGADLADLGDAHDLRARPADLRAVGVRRQVARSS